MRPSATGRARHGQRAGAWGVAAATSFYPGKNLGAYGDGGAVATNDDASPMTLRALRRPRGPQKYEHQIARLQLPAGHPPGRRAVAPSWPASRGGTRPAGPPPSRYSELLGDVPGLRLPRCCRATRRSGTSTSSAWPTADNVLARLQAAGIGAGIHYPSPIHLPGRLRRLGPARRSFRSPSGWPGRSCRCRYTPISPRPASGVGPGRASLRRASLVDDAGDEVFVHPLALCESEQIGPGTRVWAFAHVLTGAVIGADCNVCDHAYVEYGVRVGDRVTIKNGVQLFEGVTVEDDVFLGPDLHLHQ